MSTKTPKNTEAPQVELMAPSEITSYQARLQKMATEVSVKPAEIDADAEGFVTFTTPQAMGLAIDAADYVAPKYIKLHPGQHLKAVLEARGEHPMQKVDRATGEVSIERVPTYTVSIHGGKVRAWFLGAYELNKGLETVPADGTHEVNIFKGQDDYFEERRVSRYTVTARRIKGAAAPALPAEVKAS
jgi:hypothetical protein